VTSLGSAIFAFLAIGTFKTIEAAQDALCPGYLRIEPQREAVAVYRELSALYNRLYFAFGKRKSAAVEIGDVLPELRRIARGGSGVAGRAAS
jgi:L-ribulokinase